MAMLSSSAGRHEEVIPFYQREAGAVLIENSEPDESIYSNLTDI